MDIRYWKTPEDALYIHQDDVVGLLELMADDYLQHIPSHTEAGEFLEALLDRHTAEMYRQAARMFAAQMAIPPSTSAE